MVQQVKFSLYEISGYILPGFILFLAIAIFFWSAYLPDWPLGPVSLSWSIWFLIIFFSYFCGHFVQAIGNLISKVFSLDEEYLLSEKQTKIPESILNAIKSKTLELLNLDSKSINGKWLYHICDETVAQYGDTRDREVYIYREGFYRGVSVSFAFLSLSLVFRCFMPGAAIKINNSLLHISTSMIIFLIILSSLASFLFFIRYKRFVQYRISQSVVGFLTLTGNIKKLGDKKDV